MKAWGPDSAAIVQDVIAALEKCSALDDTNSAADAQVKPRLEAASALLASVLDARGIDPKKPSALFYPVRWALLGHYTGEPIAELLMVLGRAQAIDRLRHAIAVAKQTS